MAGVDSAAELQPASRALARARRRLVVERGTRRLPAALGRRALSRPLGL